MLESLISFREVNERPYIMGVWAFVICFISILISSQIPLSVPGSNAGFLSVLFIIIPSVYFITSLIKREELIEEGMASKRYASRFWQRHGKDIFILLFYFAGLTAAYAVWGLLLPQDFFVSQVTKINQIQGMTGVVTGDVSGAVLTGAASKMSHFTQIMSNNMQVMLFAFIFSFIFGAGAVFILAWNASVLGVYIGQLSKNILHIPMVALYFVPHGVLEVGGYVAAGLAGGLMSAAIIRKNSAKVLKTIAFDCFLIMLLATFLIVTGAGLEAFLS